MEKAIIKFNDGTVLEAEVNGSSYIVDGKPDFPEDLSSVTIQSDNGAQVIEDARLIECYSNDGRYWFAFGKLSETERRFAEIEDALCDLSKE